MSAVLVDLIQNHFNSYQQKSNLSSYHNSKYHHCASTARVSDDGNSNSNSNSNQSIKFQTEKLRQDLIQNYIISQTSNLSLNDDDNDDNEDDISDSYQTRISDTLINIINSVLATIVSSKLTTQNAFSKSEYYDSSITLLEYIASFICTKGNGSLLKEVLNHILQFSSISSYESVRCLTCSFIEWCTSHLFEGDDYSTFQRSRKSSSVVKSRHHDKTLLFLTGYDDDKSNLEWKMDCVQFIISNILIKRLCDKNQAVRNVAIYSSTLLLSSVLDMVIARNGSCDTDNQNDHLDDEEEEGEEKEAMDMVCQLLDALTWNMAHDPSYANRSAVLQTLPMEKLMTMTASSANNLKTNIIECIVERVRDDKVKVRVDALDVLRKVNVQNDLSVEMRCEILRHGLSTRYPATLAAATKMLCCGWMKTMKFDPIATLTLFDPTQNESTVEHIAKAIISTAGVVATDYDTSTSVEENNTTTMTTSAPISTEVTLMDLSDAEIREFKKNVMNCQAIKYSSNDNENEGVENHNDELNPATVIYLRIMYEMISTSKTLSEVKKSNLLSNIVPDVTALSDVLEKHVHRLNCLRMTSVERGNSMESDDESMTDCEKVEDDECFVCIHLLKLATAIDLNEEGSRRHLSSIIHRILCSEKIHDELIESCVHILAASSDSEASFLQSISEVLVNTIGSTDEDDIGNNDERKVLYLRAIEILSVTLEKVSRHMSKNPILQNFSSIILTTITDSSLGSLVRESGVSCMGRYVILMDEEVVISKFKVLLMEIAFTEDEKVEIRAQALLALCDLALLYERMMSPIRLDCLPDDTTVTFSDILLKCMTKSKKSLLIVSSEVAAKLMFFGRLHDANVLAHLITIYFDPGFCSDNINEGSDDVKEVGSPTRLQQLLTIFFPAYSMRSSIGRDNLLASVPALLEIINDKMNTKVKGKRSVTWPVAKIIDYVVELVEKGQDAQAENQVDDEPCPMIMLTLAVSGYLVENAHQLSTLYIRSLCKILSKSYIDVESKEQRTLILIKNNVNELSMHITDNSALRSLEPLIILLEDIESDCESETADEDKEEEDGTRNRSKRSSSFMDNEDISIESDTNHSSTSSSGCDADEESMGSATNSPKSRGKDTDISIESIIAENAIIDIAVGMKKIGVTTCNNNMKAEKSSNLSRRPSESETLPVFARIGAAGNKSQASLGIAVLAKSDDEDEEDDDDLPLFATMPANHKRKSRSRKRIIIESSDSESEANLSSSEESSSSSEYDEE